MSEGIEVPRHRDETLPAYAQHVLTWCAAIPRLDDYWYVSAEWAGARQLASMACGLVQMAEDDPGRPAVEAAIAARGPRSHGMDRE